MSNYYISFQYSAIQKLIERHQRLWSLAGTSQILSNMNETEMKGIVEKKGGKVLVAGGGKFTARFQEEAKAKEAIAEIVKLVSTTFPMLEFQHTSEPIEAESLEEARKEKKLVEVLNEQKARFRGYGVVFQPYFRVCDECGQYPAQHTKKYRKTDEEPMFLCRFCYDTLSVSTSLGSLETKAKSSIERVYREYVKILGDKNNREKSVTINKQNVKIPKEFEKLFPQKGDKTYTSNDEEERRRMAVWFSDVNNMNGKVPLWFAQDENKIPEIFRKLTEINVKIIAETLAEVFPVSTWHEHDGKTYIPFRLIVAGGDDLCLVFPEEYAIKFALTFSKQYREITGKLSDANDEIAKYLSVAWLREQAKRFADEHRRQVKDPGTYSFGGAFVVTHVHTPFSAIHRLGEELMKKAKEESGRTDNSVNWRILGLDEEISVETQVRFEKPVLIDGLQDSLQATAEKKAAAITQRLTLRDYYRLCKFYRNILTSSRIRKIADVLIAYGDDAKGAEKELIRYADVGTQKGLQYILADPEFREDNDINGEIIPGRICTLLELLTLSSPKSEANN